VLFSSLYDVAETMSVEGLKRRLPLGMRRILVNSRASLGACLVDLGNWVLNQQDDAVPPTRLHFVGNGSFGAAGYEFLRYFIEIGEMKPTDSVLDVGCGVGRMALPMTNYLKQGRYLGFDIVPKGIAWCQQKITPEHPNFQFVFADIHNEHYNPKGKQRGADYRFPVEDASIDFVFLTSVFTHLLLPEASHYIRESSRVLRSGGRMLGTWFLLNEESRHLMPTATHSPRLTHPIDALGDILVHDLSIPECAVGFSETLVRNLHQNSGLTIHEPIRYGSWCGRKEFLTYQDIVVAKK
jgi:SAM-dependent methyltransferase